LSFSSLSFSLCVLYFIILVVTSLISYRMAMSRYGYLVTFPTCALNILQCVRAVTFD
ncbi:hypothetical protein BKA70DRAFT_1279611, partial [Coprinopsis sp. MPI-PUGE-AT-0042]